MLKASFTNYIDKDSKTMHNSSQKKRSLGWWIISIALLIPLLALAACGSSAGSSTAQNTSATTGTSSASNPASSVTSDTNADNAPQKPTVPLTWIRMLDHTHGWAITKTQILKTADGGL